MSSKLGFLLTHFIILRDFYLYIIIILLKQIRFSEIFFFFLYSNTKMK
jgi:hypothetical protein